MDESIREDEEQLWQLLDITKNEMPDLAEAHSGSVKDAVYKDGSLDFKTKRLLSLAAAVQAACKDCMISPNSKALEVGAAPKEIFEACSVAIRMGGTLGKSQALVVADHLREKEIIK